MALFFDTHEISKTHWEIPLGIFLGFHLETFFLLGPPTSFDGLLMIRDYVRSLLHHKNHDVMIKGFDCVKTLFQ